MYTCSRWGVASVSEKRTDLVPLAVLPSCRNVLPLQVARSHARTTQSPTTAASPLSVSSSVSSPAVQVSGETPVGLAVGELVGDCEGAEVGDCEGAGVGDCEGAGVGDPVGAEVGAGCGC